MVSSIQGNSSWLQTSHSQQATSPEVRGEVENDGDSDDAAGAVKPASSRALPEYLGNKLNTLA